MSTPPSVPVNRTDKKIREVVAAKAPVAQKLESLVKIVEDLTPSGMLASILLLDADGRHLRHGAGPSLPAAYNAAIDGIEIGPQVGSCGTAAFRDETVSVYDIANDPLWASFKELALAHGLRACWSTPIHGQDGRVLGTFANYYRVVRDPSPADVALTQKVTKAAATIIESSASTH
jgi:GAF domain-containing protein